MDVKLTISSDDKVYFSQQISIPCVIGRARNCGVAIVHPLVSRQHCEIYEQDGEVFVRDLGSLNGTIYEGARIGRGVHIPYGDAFTIGRLAFLIEDPNGSAQTDSDSLEDLPERSSTSTSEMKVELDRRVASSAEKSGLHSTQTSADDQGANAARRQDDEASGPFTLDDL